MSRTGHLVLMLLASAEWAGAELAKRGVRVVMMNQAELDSRQLAASLLVVDQLYNGTGIAFEWCTTTLCVGGAEGPLFVLRLLDAKWAAKFRFPTTAVGLAEDSTAFVAMGKVHGIAARTGTPVKVVLAAVIAHEIGHLLLGPGHRAFGLMGPECESRHLDIARRGGKAFSEEQAEEMQARVARLR